MEAEGTTNELRGLVGSGGGLRVGNEYLKQSKVRLDFECSV
jgi:hypothetical protein